MTGKKLWHWECPACGVLNAWLWDWFEVPRCGETFVCKCEGCGVKTRLRCEMVLSE